MTVDIHTVTQLTTLVSVLIMGFTIVRKISNIEFKVNLMWAVFSRRFGTRRELGSDLTEDQE